MKSRRRKKKSHWTRAGIYGPTTATTTRLWPNHHSFENCATICQELLSTLGLGLTQFISLSLSQVDLSLNVSHGLLWVEEERRKGEGKRRCNVRGKEEEKRKKKEERREEWASGGGERKERNMRGWNRENKGKEKEKRKGRKRNGSGCGRVRGKKGKEKEREMEERG